MEVKDKKNAWTIEHKPYLKECLIGSYGGGDAQRIAKTLFQAPLPSTLIHHFLLHKNIPQKLTHLYQNLQKIPLDKRLYPLKLPPSPSDLSQIHWQCLVHVSTTIPAFKPNQSLNYMFHGWLFDQEIRNEPDRFGFSKWPWIGILETDGILPEKNIDFDSLDWSFFPDSVPGIGHFAPADQHIHWVEEYIDLDDNLMDMSDWHFGSDMSKFILSEGKEICWSWVICIDVDTNRGLLCLVIILLPPIVSLLSGTETDLTDVIRKLRTHTLPASLLSQFELINTTGH